MIPGGFIQHVQNVAGVEREHWPDQFLQWYQPGQWFDVERAVAVFIGQKLDGLRGERDNLQERFDFVLGQCRDAQSALSIVQDEIERLRRDATLYRWLVGAANGVAICECIDGEWVPVHPQSADATVARLMAAESNLQSTSTKEQQ